MVYVHAWADYQRQAEELYLRSPNKARYCVKWKPSEGKLVLKITDDTTCLKYKTHSSVYLNRFEALNLSLMEKMTNRRPPPPPPVIIAAPSPVRASTPAGRAAAQSQKMDVDEGSRAGTPSNASAGPAGGASSASAKKKKSNKKKK